MNDIYYVTLNKPDHSIARSLACTLSGTDPDKLVQGLLKKKQFDMYMEALDFVGTLPIQYREIKNE